MEALPVEAEMLELLEKKALAAPSDLIELNGTASDLPEIPVRHGRASDQDPQSVVLVGANRADEGLPAHERLRRSAGLARKAGLARTKRTRQAPYSRRLSRH
ncbi:hypothetical protein [Rhizobium gallicum]|uniref:hypothetical protein n=1 Tax=Rhizobium TaxID=379 RepID=UPI002265D5DF|nr:hypothetical protein [Rhizobium gallicum]